MKDINAMGMTQNAEVISNKGDVQRTGMIDYFLVECFDSEGNLKWKETIKNLVTNEGLDYILNVAFKGSPASGITTWYVGLKGSGSPTYADDATSLPTQTNWTEYETYTADSPAGPGERPGLTLSSPAASAGSGSIDNSAAKAVFVIDSPANDVDGVFVVDSNIRGSNSAATVLYGAGQFTGGAKTGLSVDDTLNVTVTLQADSA